MVESRGDAVMVASTGRLPPLRLAVPQLSKHDPVSTSRSSNRTCGFPASGSRTRAHAFAHGRLWARSDRRANAKGS
jgi:hypothetical protein